MTIIIIVIIIIIDMTSLRVIIAGFLTDGPAIKQQDKLRVGDWIRSIDGHQVRSPPVIIIIMIIIIIIVTIMILMCDVLR